MLKKKILTIFVALLICMVAERLLSASKASAQMQDEAKPTHQGLEKETTGWPGYKSNMNQAKDNVQYKLIRRFAHAIFFVIVLGTGAYYFSRKLVPKLTATRGKNISILETVHLGQNKTLSLLEVGKGRKLLIGSTNTAINFLADITEAVSGRPEPQNWED